MYPFSNPWKRQKNLQLGKNGLGTKEFAEFLITKKLSGGNLACCSTQLRLNIFSAKSTLGKRMVNTSF